MKLPTLVAFSTPFLISFQPCEWHRELAGSIKCHYLAYYFILISIEEARSDLSEVLQVNHLMVEYCWLLITICGPSNRIFSIVQAQGTVHVRLVGIGP